MVNSGGVSGRSLAVLPPPENWSYLDMKFARRVAMPALVSTARLSRPLLLLALVVGLIMAATLSLWAYYGTAVFFEIVRTGWVACF